VEIIENFEILSLNFPREAERNNKKEHIVTGVSILVNG
jgi:hypothetical protein